MKKSFCCLLFIVLVFTLIGINSEVRAEDTWKPTKTITIVVPWPAGRASDTVGRMISGEMEQILGQKMVIVNTPGGGGAIGTQEVWDKPHDGYTITANAMTGVVSYMILGKMDVSFRDWAFFLPIFTPNVITVKGDSPINTMDDLLAYMKENDGKTVLASAGVGSSGYFAAEIFKKVTGLSYNHVPYAGGAPAITAVASGEAEVVMQLSAEVAEFLRGGQLKALAVTSAQDLVIDGYGTIPSIQKFIPDYPDYGSYFGLLAPADMPKEVLKAYEDAFVKAAGSKAVSDYAKTKGCIPVAIYGEESKELIEKLARTEAWLLWDAGVATVNPADCGLPRPE